MLPSFPLGAKKVKCRCVAQEQLAEMGIEGTETVGGIMEREQQAERTARQDLEEGEERTLRVGNRKFFRRDLEWLLVI